MCLDAAFAKNSIGTESGHFNPCAAQLSAANIKFCAVWVVSVTVDSPVFGGKNSEGVLYEPPVLIVSKKIPLEAFLKVSPSSPRKENTTLITESTSIWAPSPIVPSSLDIELTPKVTDDMTTVFGVLVSAAAPMGTQHAHAATRKNIMLIRHILDAIILYFGRKDLVASTKQE
jgi:hypothetical protein